MAVHLLVSALFFTAISLTDVVNSFSIRPTISDVTRTTSLFNNNPNNEYQQLQSRKQILNKFLSSTSAFLIVGCATTATTNTPAAYAVDGDVKWITGKAPKIEGKKPNDPNDVKGTRKDPNFLRSISDCKNKCENTPGPDGLSRSKEDCLSICQDVCCTTYEQCTFSITPRI